MSRSAAARRFARLVAGLRRPAPTRRARLALQPLEDRAVPANSIFLADRLTESANIKVTTVGDTATIATTDASATLSLATIEAALTDDPTVKHVIVTTAVADVGTDAEEAGEIFWDGAFILDQLDLTGAGTGKTLTFKTVQNPDPIEAPATGNIILTGVRFANNGTEDQISLVFDSSDVGGAVMFGDTLGAPTVIYSAEAVLDLTVKTGGGDFVFYDDGNIRAADAGGAVRISAGLVDISHTGGLTAGAGMSISGTQVSLADTTGLYAVGDLTVAGANSLTAGSTGFESEAGAMSLAGGVVTLIDMILGADGDLTVSGGTSVELTSKFGWPVESRNGNIAITGGDVNLPSTDLFTEWGNVTVSGTNVAGWLSAYARHGSVAITGTKSVGLTNASVDYANSGTTIAGGTVTLTNSVFLNLEGGDVTVTGTDVTLNDTQLATSEGSLTLTGTNIVLAPGILSANGDVTVTGPVTLGPGLSAVGAVAPARVTFAGPVDAQTAGQPDLEVSAGTVLFKQSVGATAGLDELNVRHGNTTVAGNILNAASIILFDPLPGPFPDDNRTVPATLGIAGTVTGNILAKATADGRGNLAPGRLNNPGTMTVRGNVTLNGDFELDLALEPGGQTDVLAVVDNPATPAVEGNITIGPASKLGQFGVGRLYGTSTVIDADAPVVGQFANAPVGAGLLVGTDYITVETYSPDVKVAPMPAVSDPFRGVDADGTRFTITLSGPGSLVTGTEADGDRFVVLRDTTATSRLGITTLRSPGSDDILTLGAGLLVNGALASVTAPKVDIGSQFRSTGPIAAATFRDFVGVNGPGIGLGGTVVNKTSITARNIPDDVRVGSTLSALRLTKTLGNTDPFGPGPIVTAPAIGVVTAQSAVADVVTAGKLTRVTVAQTYTGDVTAAAIGRFQARSGFGSLTATGAPGVPGVVGAVVGTGPDELTLDVRAQKVTSVSVAGTLSTTDIGWHVSDGIPTLTAGALSANITAGYLGTVLVRGNLATGLTGDILSSTITLTGYNAAAAGAYGIKSLTARGSVRFSLFDVEAGNVGTFTVGRFIGSQLHLNYNAHDFFNETFATGGSFGAQGFKLGAFRTTAAPLGDPANPLYWAFQGSEIAADQLGTVLLSGLETANNEFGFGIKVRTTPGSVKVARADDLRVPLNVNLVPDSVFPYDPIVEDFYFIDV